MSTQVSRSHDLSERLVRRAARNAPPDLRERLEEEWLADLAERPGFMARLRFAAGCHWASRVIAIERPGPRLAVAGHGRLEVGAPPVLNRRTLSFVLVMALHALLFYVAWSSLLQTHAPKPIGPVQYTPVPQQPHATFRPSSPVDLSHVNLPVPLPPPETPIDPEQTAPSRMTDTMNGPDPGADAPPVERRPVPQRRTGGPAAGFPNVDDFYPAPAIRAGEEGSTQVRVCVKSDGRLDAEPVTQLSSGFARLDAAALKLAKAGSGHYRATSEDGRAVPSCFAYAVRFQLKNVR